MGIYPREMKTLSMQKPARERKLTAALSLIAKKRKQQKLSSIGEWLNKQQYIHTMQ